ncbi:hypothetical protein E0D97_13340 [Oricola cellulosilytica]|uniref:Uncharacterized protein n=1 Tax=Oricola cellulosilytica TaxID=1429082 RepID=A0A4R0P9D0_9HYPH|nr:hypothetical protein [Oricola cellulosilytica]TCD13458.1 hypothetical protein E0D97_13340 [Oricola cellulosilytica]
MAFEEWITRLNMLFSEMENQPEDNHELLEQIHQELNRMKATGQPLPADLVALEERLDREFIRAGHKRPAGSSRTADQA